MKILHLFDHSLPIQDGYAYRSLNILKQQKILGWTTAHLTSMKHDEFEHLVEEFEQFEFHRTPMSRSPLATLPVLKIGRASCRERVEISVVAVRIEQQN